jgi:opacity protein-like surface antigen
MKTAFVAMMALLLPCAGGLAAHSMSVSEELDAQYSYVGDAKTRGAGLNNGSVDEHRADLKYVVSPQVNKDLLLRFGFEWQRLSFGVPVRAAVPGVLQQVSGVLGFDYQVADEWLMRVEVEPGIYSDFRDIGWRDFDASLVLGAAYLASADLQWFFGMRVDARSQYPVLPAAGVRWKFADEWTLNFMLPNPRLEYEVNERLKLYLGGGVEAGTYAVGENFGTPRGQPKLDGAIVDFLEVRLGAGWSWKIMPTVTLEAEAGYMPYRVFDFFDPDIEIRSHNAPYGQIACHARF